MPDRPWADLAFWAAAAACVVAQVAIVRSVVVARAPEGGDIPRPAARPRAPEIAWAVVPAIALALVLVLTWRELHPAPAAAPARGAPAPGAPSAGAPAASAPAAPGAAEVYA
jgi:heme/copper-type cytochrome/quinol oxidase subunit 2